MAKTLVNPKEEEVIVSILNLSDHPVKVNQNSSIGKLENVDHIYHPEHKELENVNSTVLPQHLERLLQNASTKLTAEEKHRLEHLVIDYQDVFMLPDRKLGQTHTIEHEINTGSHQPIKLAPRRIPIFKRKLVDQEIDKMIEDGIIEPSDSPWSAPIFLVKKKDGSCRFCVDFQKLNAVTLRDAYPLLRIDDTLDSLSVSLWFSTLDLAMVIGKLRYPRPVKRKQLLQHRIEVSSTST